jgi:cell wall-associated NlpC family hydrolase
MRRRAAHPSPARSPLPGALVFFGQQNNPHHVGISLGNNRYVSALGRAWGTVITSLQGSTPADIR